MKVAECIGLVVILLAVSGCDDANATKKPIAPGTTVDAGPATPEKPSGTTSSPAEGYALPKEAATNQEPESPEVLYQRKRSELYDLVDAAGEVLDFVRHQGNFGRTCQRLSQFNADLSAEAEKNLAGVVDRVNSYLTTLLTYNNAVVRRASAVMGMEEELGSGIMNGTLPEATVKSGFREILAGAGQIGVFVWQDFSVYQGAMWDFFTGWELHHWDWAESAKEQEWMAGIRMPRMPKMSTDEWPKNMCSRDDWNGAVFAVGSYPKTKFLRGTLTAGDLFVQLATIRLCERWIVLARDTDTKIKNFSSSLPRALAERIPWDMAAQDDGAKSMAEKMLDDSATSMAKDAAWIESLLEEKLMHYPWPWPVPGKDAHLETSSAKGAEAEAHQGS